MSTPPFKSVPRGTEGAVSLEGTIAGVVASFFFAGVGVRRRRVRRERRGRRDVRGVHRDDARELARGDDAREGRVRVAEPTILVNMIQIVIAAGIAVASYPATAVSDASRGAAGGWGGRALGGCA